MASNKLDDRPVQLIRRSLTVIVVAHNDADGLAATIERLHRAVLATTEDFEILIFDDGSTDSTAKIAHDASGRFSGVRTIRHNTRMGVGYCFERGSQEATSNFLAYVPADNTWPYRSYVELFGNIGKADVVISYSINFETTMPPMRRLVSWAYTTILNAIFRFGLHYYNGLAIYPCAFLRSVSLTTTGLGFQAELLIRAVSAGYSFLEVGLPIDNATAVKSRSVTVGNIAGAFLMIGRMAAAFYFAPTSLRTPHAVRPLVRAGPAVDELSVTPHQSTRSLFRPAQSLRIAITGASSGIGETLARALGADGHSVFICARREERLAEIAREYPTVYAVSCDITDEGQVAAFVSAISAKVDGLDALINCAGAFGEIGLATSTDSAAWWDTMHVNVFGTYLTIKQCLPLLESGSKARIINLAGGGAFSPFPNYSAYACSKAALVRLTECLAIELHPKNIRVNAVSPGIIATDIHKATLEAGEERAGRLQYRRTLSFMADGGPSSEGFVDCVRALLSPAFDRLTGKTISANFDPWQTDVFVAQIDNITASDLYTLRRMNLTNLNEGYLRKLLSQAWANFGSRN